MPHSLVAAPCRAVTPCARFPRYDRMRPMRTPILCLPLLCLTALTPVAAARDFYLTIGGGPSAESNQASLENNVLFYEQLLKEQNIPTSQQAVYFADGS